MDIFIHNSVTATIVNAVAKPAGQFGHAMQI